MEKPKTQAEQRKAEFNRHADNARQIADDGLRAIDAALADEAELREQLRVGVEYGNITADEMDMCLADYHRTRFPITDGDPLASPIGYYEPPASIYE